MPKAMLAATFALGACSPEGGQTFGPSNEPVAAAAAPSGENVSSPVPTMAAEQAPPHPCRVQDGKAVPANLLRAIGTEPFWGARIDGRCVTYSTPEDIKGTRIWTRFSGTAERGTWAGAIDGRRFELRTAPDPRCSDGMSDNVYPMSVTLFVRGEERRGCAEPR